MSVKRSKYDDIFSKCIRERNNYTCEKCGIYTPEGKARLACHCAHIHGRASNATRWDADNAVCLCAACHREFTHHPTDFYRWLKDYLGEGYLQILSEKAHSVKKWTKADKEAMYQHYKNEHKLMLQRRKEGVQGRITFLNFGF